MNTRKTGSPRAKLDLMGGFRLEVHGVRTAMPPNAERSRRRRVGSDPRCGGSHGCGPPGWRRTADPCCAWTTPSTST